MTSLLLLIDGYNVLSPAAPPTRGDARWLQRERTQLIDRLATHLSTDLCSRTCVVFDSANPPPDRPSRFSTQGIDVWFAIDYPEADDLLEELIRRHHSPKQLAVVSSDRRVQSAARRRGAAAFDSQTWLDRLLDGVIGLAPRARNPQRSRKPSSGKRRSGNASLRQSPLSSTAHFHDPQERSSGAGQGGEKVANDRVPPDAGPEIGPVDEPWDRDESGNQVDPEDVQQWLRAFGFEDEKPPS